MLRGSLAKLALLGFGFLASFYLFETVASFYVHNIAMRGRLFEPDDSVGWKNLPNLDLIRSNPEGAGDWRVVTNPEGFRGNSNWDDSAQRRVLVLGDSFAFGQGVNVEDRFDSVLARQLGDWSFVNIGVIGYGTDQEVLASRAFTSQLRPGDVVLVVSFLNDISDVLRESSVGRSKPHFTLESGRLVHHEPEMTWLGALRDRYYLGALISSRLEQRRAFSDRDYEHGGVLFRTILGAEAKAWAEAGLQVVLAYHAGTKSVGGPAKVRTFRASAAELCDTAPIVCIDIDAAISPEEHPEYYLSDHHWTVPGNAAVARALQSRIREAGLDGPP